MLTTWCFGGSGAADTLASAAGTDEELLLRTVSCDTGMEVAGFPEGIAAWKAPPFPPQRPRSGFGPKSRPKRERLNGGNNFTHLGCPFTERLPDPKLANARPAPPAVSRAEARRAIKALRESGRERWMALPKPERAELARQRVMTERAVAALPPLPPPVKGPRSRDFAPHRAATERGRGQPFRIDESEFSTVQLRADRRGMRARERAGPMDATTTAQSDFELDRNPILLRPPGGEPGKYNRPEGIFTNYMNRSLQLKINIHVRPLPCLSRQAAACSSRVAVEADLRARTGRFRPTLGPWQQPPPLRQASSHALIGTF